MFTYSNKYVFLHPEVILNAYITSWSLATKLAHLCSQHLCKHSRKAWVFFCYLVDIQLSLVLSSKSDGVVGVVANENSLHILAFVVITV